MPQSLEDTIHRLRIQAIAGKLMTTIPHPPRKRPIEQKSWAQLKPGQQVELVSDWYYQGYHIPAGDRGEVVKTTNLGATIQFSGTVAQWQDRDWQRCLKRVRKRRTRKKE